MITLGLITWTTPLMLLGTAAVAAPILAHLLNRRARRRITFPSIQLLVAARADQSGLFRLRRLAVLLLRCGVLILMACAFARPLWVDGAAASAGGVGTRSTVLVLDTSASMGQRVGDVRLIDRVRGEAQRLIGGLEPGADRANIIYAGFQARGAYDEPIVNLTVLRAELNDLEAGQGRADLAGAIDLAGAQLAAGRDTAASPAGARHVVVMSDMQRDNWGEAATAVGALQQNGIDVTVVPIGDRGEANAGVWRVRSEPAIPIAGAVSRISATVSNHADTARTVTVRAWVNEIAVGARGVRLEGRGETEVGFDHTFHDEGPHRVRFGIDDDALAVDNRAYAVASVARRVRVALIDDGDRGRATGSGFFLERALAPHGDDRDGLEVVALRSDAITGAALKDIEAVLLGNASALNEAAAKDLVGHVRGGGGLMLFYGPGAVTQNVAALNHAGEDAFVPFTPIGRRRHAGVDEPLRIGGAAWSTGPMRAFDISSQEALASVRFDRSYAVEVAADRAAVLMRFTDGSAALAGQGFGAGRVLAGNFSAAPEFGDLAKHGVFVALVHAIVDDLRDRTRRGATRLVGAPLTLTLDSIDPTGEIDVTDPNNEKVGADTTRSEQGLTVGAGRATLSGFYTFRSGDQALATEAVNVDPRESNLDRVGLDELTEDADDAAIATGVRVGADPANDSGRRLWHWLALGAMGLYAVELLILCVWRR
ncbi:MAG: BatA domain-containing protein [Planctomycetota bacterium]|jgi:hypothetical protein